MTRRKRCRDTETYDFIFRPDLVSALHPPLCRFHSLRLTNDRSDRFTYESELDNTFPLLGLRRERDFETFLGHPSLEIIEIIAATTDVCCDLFCKHNSLRGWWVKSCTITHTHSLGILFWALKPHGTLYCSPLSFLLS